MKQHSLFNNQRMSLHPARAWDYRHVIVLAQLLAHTDGPIARLSALRYLGDMRLRRNKNGNQ